MNKRIINKLQKSAAGKIIGEQPLSQMERIAHNKTMEKWLGRDIVKKIRDFGRV